MMQAVTRPLRASVSVTGFEEQPHGIWGTLSRIRDVERDETGLSRTANSPALRGQAYVGKERIRWYWTRLNKPFKWVG